MRRFVCLLAVALLAVPSLGSDAPTEYEGATEAAGIEGAWQLVAFEYQGGRVKPDLQGVLTCRGETFALAYNSVESLRGSYRVDPAQSPPQLDWVPSGGELKGKTLKLLYRIDGDTLTVAFRTGDDWSRPQGFGGKGVATETYRRVK
jgi:uncharacterized protein (TIGR03067 family)